MTETARGPRTGDRYVVREGFNAHVLTQWRAPFTGGSQQILPVGLEFVIDHDPMPKSKGIAARPDPYDVWERELVSQEDREAEKYGGYYLVVLYELLDAHCELIGSDYRSG
jgi:hypothetical protein